ncbi:MAG: DUF5615 family PIN-like protein [Thermus sp.]
MVVDVCLSPKWVPYLRAKGLEAFHWSELGDLRAKDREILAYCAQNGFALLTYDLDFAALLFSGETVLAKVVLLRASDPRVERAGPRVVEALLNVERYLEGGGVAVVEDQRVRYRSLP